jgi:cytochrome c biogenesis protein CcdA
VFRALLVCVLLAAQLAAPSHAVALEAEESTPTLILFWGDGCPHCEAEWRFLSDLTADHPDLKVIDYEVWHSETNKQIFIEVLAERGEKPSGVPTTLLGGRTWVGFNEATAGEIAAAVEAAMAGVAPPPDQSSVIDLPLLGERDMTSTSLVVSTVLIAFVDGFNPCSLWALSILLALVLRTGSRRRVIAVGVTFLVVTAALYALYIVGLYGVLELAAHATWIRASMAAVALAFGAINVKDYFAFKRGPSLTISEKAKPALYRRMRRAAEDRPIQAVLGGTVVLATGVSILETPCTAGYPLLWTDLVTRQGVGTTAAIALFGLYMAVFLLDEFAVFGTAVVAMRAAKLEERHGRALKLVSGTLMIVLAAVLILAPELMQNLMGVTLTFGVATAVSAIILAIDRRIRPEPSPLVKTR